MTISTAERRNEYTASGGQTVFPYTFRIFAEADLQVYQAGVLKTLTTHYTVSGVDSPTGGNVTLVTGAIGGESIIILSDTVEDQQADYIAQGPFPAETHEKALDKLTVIIQEHEELLRRALVFKVFSLLKDKTIDDLEANKFARAKSDLTGIQWVDVVPAGSIGVPVSVAQGGTGSTTAAAARDTLMADEDTRTITVKVVNTQKSTTTGTPAAGIGTGEKFQAESADESPSDFGQIEFAASDVGAGTEDTYFQILLRIAGAALSAAYRFVAMTAFRAIFTHANSADRTYTLPNKTGSVAMLDDIFLLSGLAGLGLSNNGVDATNDIDIAVGAAISNDAVLANRVAMSLTSALTKQLDAAWAVGNNAGMRDTGAISDATWHIFLIKRTDTGVVDVLASLSFSSPTMPTNYDKKKWIGAIIRTAAAIKAFSHYQDEFLWKATVLDINAIDPGTAAVTRTLTVPTGLKVQALMNIGVQIGAASSSSSAYISSLDINDEAPSITVAPMAQVRNVTVSTVSQARIVCRTDTSAQVRSRISASDGGIVLYGATLGWRVDRAEV